MFYKLNRMYFMDTLQNLVSRQNIDYRPTRMYPYWREQLIENQHLISCHKPNDQPCDEMNQDRKNLPIIDIRSPGVTAQQCPPLFASKWPYNSVQQNTHNLWKFPDRIFVKLLYLANVIIAHGTDDTYPSFAPIAWINHDLHVNCAR